MDSLLFQIATKDGGFQENMSCYHKIQNCTMRFDAVYHLLKIYQEAFDKSGLFRWQKQRISIN